MIDQRIVVSIILTCIIFFYIIYSSIYIEYEKRNVEEKAIQQKHEKKVIDSVRFKFSNDEKVDKNVKSINQIDYPEIYSKIPEQKYECSRYQNKQLPYRDVPMSMINIKMI
jgi:sensor domain CHASE-containing protein